jgi:C1A family cysteine protease
MQTRKPKAKVKGKAEEAEYHSIIVTGFGKTNDGKNYWNIKSTWGENWGDSSGYAKIA